MAEAVLYKGRLIRVPFEVRGPDEHGMQFHGRFRTSTRQITNHTTGAENTPHQMYHNMMTHEAYGKRSPLSVHFCVDPEGKVYQFADTELLCAHVGTKANAVTVGIEFVCRFDDFDKVPHKGVQRLRITDRIHGKACTYDALTPAQITTGVALNEALCDLYNLPLVVPMSPAGNVWATALTDTQLSGFKGCTGHLHYKPGKRDPGLRILRAIQERGEERGGIA